MAAQKAADYLFTLGLYLVSRLTGGCSSGSGDKP